MGDGTSEMKGKLEENAKKNTKWLHENCLMLAPEKSDVMLVSNQ